MITYEKFWKLCEERKETTWTLSRYQGISTRTLAKIRHNENVSTVTINHLCRILHCQPGDLMTYVPDPEEEESR